MESNLNVKQCSLCPGYTEYFCHSCQKDLCQHCKAVHVIDLETKHHDVTIYREKLKYLLKQEKCVKHCDKKYNQYCKTCEVPLCDSCSDHKHPGSVAWFFPEVHSKHKHVDIRTAYQTKRQKHKQTIHDVRSELLYNARVLRRKLSSDIQSWPRKIDRGQSKIRVRGQRLKDLMDIVLLDEINKRILCLLSITAKLQKVEHRYEQSANRPVEFLHLKKKSTFPK